MGGADYASIAPLHSYIDALKFKGPRHLADYLIALDQDDQFYTEFFKWKKHLHSPEEQWSKQSYSSLVPFWDGHTRQCRGAWNDTLIIYSNGKSSGPSGFLYYMLCIAEWFISIIYLYTADCFTDISNFLKLVARFLYSHMERNNIVTLEFNFACYEWFICDIDMNTCNLYAV